MKPDTQKIITSIFAFLVVGALITAFNPKAGTYIALATLIGILGYQLKNKSGVFAGTK
jgi:hypothetical protein